MFLQLLHNKKIKSFSFIFFASVTSSFCYAGGDYWKVKVLEVIELKEKTQIALKIAKHEHSILKGCSKVDVIIVGYDKPWWDFFSLTTSHLPTETNTKEAFEYLESNKNMEIYFGYVGGGLMPDSQKACTYISGGIKLEFIEGLNRDVVFSYNDD